MRQPGWYLIVCIWNSQPSLTWTVKKASVFCYCGFVCVFSSNNRYGGFIGREGGAVCVCMLEDGQGHDVLLCLFGY